MTHDFKVEFNNGDCWIVLAEASNEAIILAQASQIKKGLPHGVKKITRLTGNGQARDHEPCPFCGCGKLFFDADNISGGKSIQCDGCGVLFLLGVDWSESEAWALWDKRA